MRVAGLWLLVSFGALLVSFGGSVGGDVCGCASPGPAGFPRIRPCPGRAQDSCGSTSPQLVESAALKQAGPLFPRSGPDPRRVQAQSAPVTPDRTSQQGGFEQRFVADSGQAWPTSTTCFGVHDDRRWPACNAQVCAGVRGRWLCLNTPVPAG